MRGMRHPLNGAIYDLQADGTVRVTKGDQSGVFTTDGVYISGDIYAADIHYCVWVGTTDLRQTTGQVGFFGSLSETEAA